VAGHADQGGEQKLVRRHRHQLETGQRQSPGLRGQAVVDQPAQQVGFGDHAHMTVALHQQAVGVVLVKRGHRLGDGAAAVEYQRLAHALMHLGEHKARHGHPALAPLGKKLVLAGEALAEVIVEFFLILAQRLEQVGRYQITQSFFFGNKPVTAATVKHAERAEQITGTVDTKPSRLRGKGRVQFQNRAFVNQINKLRRMARFDNHRTGFEVRHFHGVLETVAVFLVQQ
jgi:hypothetical protein